MDSTTSSDNSWIKQESVEEGYMVKAFNENLVKGIKEECDDEEENRESCTPSTSLQPEESPPLSTLMASIMRAQARRDRKQQRRKEQLECEQCGKTVNRSSMPKHLKTHTRVKKFICALCGRGYDRLDFYEIHMRLHIDEKPHRCSLCNKAFKHKRKMLIHETSHKKEKPFICSLCDKAFSDSSALYKHIRAHNGVKPYECSWCGKAFNESSKVVRHMRIHTGEKPYECPACGRKTSDKSSMSKHLKTHNLDDTAIIYHPSQVAKNSLQGVSDGMLEDIGDQYSLNETDKNLTNVSIDGEQFGLSLNYMAESISGLGVEGAQLDSNYMKGDVNDVINDDEFGLNDQCNINMTTGNISGLNSKADASGFIQDEQCDLNETEGDISDLTNEGVVI